MTILTTLLSIVVPVFLVVGAGYTAVRFRYFREAFVDALVQYGVKVAVPVLLFLSMTRIDLAASVNVRALVAFFAAGTVCFLGAMLLSRLLWKRRPGESVAVGFCTFFPNVVMLGIPISERAFGAEAMGAVFGIIAFHSIYNYFVGFIAREMVRKDRAGIVVALSRASVASFKNPLMIGLVSGMAWNLGGVTIPGVVEGALDMVAASALPVALFSLGGVLTRYSLKAEAGEAMMVSAFSLLVHPALAWMLAGPVLGLEREFVQAAVILAAMPAGINGYIFATMYNRAVGTAASAALLATALSVLTVTAWLAFLGVVYQ
ncbi:MAG: AEC family transporter [Pseudomonadota bacterium]